MRPYLRWRGWAQKSTRAIKNGGCPTDESRRARIASWATKHYVPGSGTLCVAVGASTTKRRVWIQFLRRDLVGQFSRQHTGLVNTLAYEHAWWWNLAPSCPVGRSTEWNFSGMFYEGSSPITAPEDELIRLGLLEPVGVCDAKWVTERAIIR